MNEYREKIYALARTVDEPTRRSLFEYALLHAELSVLTGVENPSEASLTDIAAIEDRTDRARANTIAQKMRWISRSVGSSL